MRVLLDTCVLSELQEPKGCAEVHAAVLSVPEEARFISVITIGEIVKGITMLPDGRRKRDLSGWLAEIEGRHEDRLLPVDREVAQIWGEISANARKKGVQVPLADGLIAATALRNGLHVMTRNRKDFAATGALIIDPWQMN